MKIVALIVSSSAFECLPAHSTFNHFRSIIFQHIAPHSRSHLWCTHKIMWREYIKSSAFLLLSAKWSKQNFFLSLFRKRNIRSLKGTFSCSAFMLMPYKHQTDFLCCNCAVNFLLAGELKSLHPTHVLRSSFYLIDMQSRPRENFCTKEWKNVTNRLWHALLRDFTIVSHKNLLNRILNNHTSDLNNIPDDHRQREIGIYFSSFVTAWRSIQANVLYA